MLVRREVGSAVNCPTRERLPVSASSALPSRTASVCTFRIDRATEAVLLCRLGRMVLTCMPRTSLRTSRWSASTRVLLTLRAYLPSIGCPASSSPTPQVEPYAVLPASQVVRFIVPRYVQDDPSLAGVLNDSAADRAGEKLADKTVRDVLPEHLMDVPAANAATPSSKWQPSWRD